MVYLGVRPVGPTPHFHLNGRETFLAGVEWVDDWPVVDESAFEIPPWSGDIDDDFSAPALDLRWVAPGLHPHAFTSPAPGGGIEVRHPESPDHRRLLATPRRALGVGGAGDRGRRAVPGSCSASDDAHWVAVESTGTAVSARAVVGPFDQVLGNGRRSRGVDRHARDPLERSRPPGMFGMTPITDTARARCDRRRRDSSRSPRSTAATSRPRSPAGSPAGSSASSPCPSSDEPAILRHFRYRGL